MVPRLQKFQWKGLSSLFDYLDDLRKAIEARTPIPDGKTVKADEYPFGIRLRAITAEEQTVTYRPFQLVQWATAEGELRVRVYPSTVDGDVPDEWDDPFLLTPSAGTKYVYFHVELEDHEDGPPTVDSVTITQGSSIPANTVSDKYTALGQYTYSESEDGATLSLLNYSYGPATTTLCRDWFSTPPTYTFSFYLTG